MILLWTVIIGLMVHESKPLDMHNPAEMDKFAHEHLKVGKGGYVYGPPTFTDADEGDVLMPPQHKCDGCIAVAYKLEKKFAEEEDRRSKKGSALSEVQIIDVVDKVCSKSFRMFGIKSVNGRNRLSGLGLRAHYEPGVSAAGEGWMERVRGVCREIVGLYEEEEIYRLYSTNKETRLAEKICKSYCTAAQLREFREDQEYVIKKEAEEKGFSTED